MSIPTSQMRQDGHCHYTGSLSKGYLEARLKVLFPNQDTPLTNYIPQFSSDWKMNYQEFFASYQKIQNITKSSDRKEQYQLYASGAYDICRNNLSENINSFDLRVGPKLDLNATINRISAMTEGFAKAENEVGKAAVGRFILTLIHDENGKFINVTSESLSELIHHLSSNPKNSHRILGFDFSGPEKRVDTKMVFTLLNIIENSNTKRPSNQKYLITFHAGEYVNQNIIRQFNYLDKILDHQINRLSHGTILWLKPILLDPQNPSRIEKWQNHLLKKLIDKNITLEICPTANLLLSPLQSINDIPFSKFTQMGLQYSINTDNKTILNTTLSQETSLCSPGQH